MYSIYLIESCGGVNEIICLIQSGHCLLAENNCSIVISSNYSGKGKNKEKIPVVISLLARHAGAAVPHGSPPLPALPALITKDTHSIFTVPTGVQQLVRETMT